MSMGPETKRHHVCVRCHAPAPAVQTGGTLGSLGWRMRLMPRKDGGLATMIEWVCPECSKQSTGSAPH
jgi:hypothetical protein